MQTTKCLVLNMLISETAQVTSGFSWTYNSSLSSESFFRTSVCLDSPKDQNPADYSSGISSCPVV